MYFCRLTTGRAMSGHFVRHATSRKVHNNKIGAMVASHSFHFLSNIINEKFNDTNVKWLGLDEINDELPLNLRRTTSWSLLSRMMHPSRSRLPVPSPQISRVNGTPEACTSLTTSCGKATSNWLSNCSTDMALTRENPSEMFTFVASRRRLGCCPGLGAGRASR